MFEKSFPQSARSREFFKHALRLLSYLSNFKYFMMGMEKTMGFIYICENDLRLRGKIEEEITSYTNEKKYQMKIQFSDSDSMSLLEELQGSTKRGYILLTRIILQNCRRNSQRIYQAIWKKESYWGKK